MLNLITNSERAILELNKLKSTKGINAKDIKFPNKTIKPTNLANQLL